MNKNKNHPEGNLIVTREHRLVKCFFAKKCRKLMFSIYKADIRVKKVLNYMKIA